MSDLGIRDRLAAIRWGRVFVCVVTVALWVAVVWLIWCCVGMHV